MNLNATIFFSIIIFLWGEKNLMVITVSSQGVY
jgi:hypothetical protein